MSEPLINKFNNFIFIVPSFSSHRVFFPPKDLNSIIEYIFLTNDGSDKITTPLNALCAINGLQSDPLLGFGSPFVTEHSALKGSYWC